MSRYLCQGCSTSQLSWNGSCPSCGSNRVIQLEAQDSVLGRTVNGKYKVLRKLGQGGMGSVYEGEVQGIGQRVALKFLSSAYQMDASAASRFLNEAKGLARLSHPNAIKLMDFEQDQDGRLFFSMEFIDGLDLKKFVQQNGRLSLREATQVVIQVADALAHAHSRGVIHRDLKPENIMIRKWAGGGLFVTVLDFGLARLVGEGASRLTTAGTLMGSPHYMSPEQAFGREVDQRSDIYSLGLIFYELVSGLPPFDAEGMMEVLRMQREEPTPHLPETAENQPLSALDAAIQRATAKAPDARFASMADFSAPIEDFALGLGSAPRKRAINEPPFEPPGEPPGVSTSPMPASPLRPERSPSETVGDPVVRAGEAGSKLNLRAPTPRPPAVSTPAFPSATLAAERDLEDAGGTPAKLQRNLLYSGAAGLLCAGGAVAFFALRPSPPPPVAPVVAAPFATEGSATPAPQLPAIAAAPQTVDAGAEPPPDRHLPPLAELPSAPASAPAEPNTHPTKTIGSIPSSSGKYREGKKPPPKAQAAGKTSAASPFGGLNDD